VTRTAWLDCSAGVAGDMLLGALVDAGVPLPVLQAAVDAVAPEPVLLRAEEVRRAGLRALRVHVDGATSTAARTWTTVRGLLEAADLAEGVRSRALATFEALAGAEAAVHGTDPGTVHFHEVGALDAVADVVGTAAGLEHLGLDAVHASPVAVGGGSVRAAHGTLPVPAPAVVRLLLGRPTVGGPADVELATPTGAALLVAAVPAAAWGPQPPMRVERVGVGAGARDLPGRANVVRLLVGAGDPDGAGGLGGGGETALVLETNVDDLDPRLWPGVLEALLAAGASDAWLTPVLMKKGRPAHTLHVLVTTAQADAVRRVVLTETTAIGLRQHPVGKVALDRRSEVVEVAGRPVRVKLALLDGEVVNAQPEYEDVAGAARALGRPAKEVLAAATAAATGLVVPLAPAGGSAAAAPADRG
jgi:pyridinium-3,5-bisthiocarboxylic acid mononucleotide nickel chelatase